MKKRDRKKLQGILKEASSKAIRSSKALGLTIHVIEDRKILAKRPDNSVEIIGTIETLDVDLSKYKKGMVLVRK